MLSNHWFNQPALDLGSARTGLCFHQRNSIGAFVRHAIPDEERGKGGDDQQDRSHGWNSLKAPRTRVA